MVTLSKQENDKILLKRYNEESTQDLRLINIWKTYYIAINPIIPSLFLNSIYPGGGKFAPPWFLRVLGGCGFNFWWQPHILLRLTPDKRIYNFRIPRTTPTHGLKKVTFWGGLWFVRVPPYESGVKLTNFSFSWQNCEFFWSQQCCTHFLTQNEELSKKIGVGGVHLHG